MNSVLERARLDKVQEDAIRALEQAIDCRVVALVPKATYAHLSHDQFVRLEDTEKELGVALVAYQAVSAFRIAQVPDPELKRLQLVEKDAGLVLLAYEHVRQKPQLAEIPPEEGYETANLSDEKYERLQRCESDTGLVLMAYRKIVRKP